MKNQSSSGNKTTGANRSKYGKRKMSLESGSSIVNTGSSSNSNKEKLLNSVLSSKQPGVPSSSIVRKQLILSSISGKESDSDRHGCAKISPSSMKCMQNIYQNIQNPSPASYQYSESMAKSHKNCCIKLVKEKLKNRRPSSGVNSK